MKKNRSYESLEEEISLLRSRLEEAEETLAAIQGNEVDALIINGPQGSQVYTLQGAEHPYRVFVEKMKEGAATVSREGMILHCNTRFAEMLGLPLERIVGAFLPDFMDSRDGPHLGIAVAECRAEGARGEAFFGPKGQRTMEVHFSVSPMSVARGDLCVVVTDLTDLKRAQKALKESETRYRRLVETAEEGIWAVDRASKITFVNSKVADILGYAPEELLGNEFTLFMVEEDRPQGQDLGGPTGLRFARFRRKSGETVLCRVSSCAITDDEGRPGGSFAMLTDITEQRRLEEELRQAQKMEAMGTLAGGIAHDFNNILAAIIGFSEMALDDIPPHHPARRPLQLVMKSGFRGRDLVKQILAFSRRTSFERKPLSIAPVVTETMKLIRASLPANVEIELHVNARSSIVMADLTEIQQIIMNLATNAGYAMRMDGGRLTISLSDRRSLPKTAEGMAPKAGPYVMLTVKDTGIGMDQEVMKRIFDPFFTTKGVGEGTGMGLAVVYGIVKNLKGYVSVESTPGIGTAFHIYIPRLVRPMAPRSTAPKLRGGREHILFVDDEELLVQWGKETLAKLGYTVTALTDGVSALKSFSEDPARFDLVLTDQTMPEITGIEFAEECLKMRPNLPVILCTGHSDTVSPEIARSTGITTFLMKPLSRIELAEAIRRALEGEPR